ncbi:MULTISPECIES: MFS transporter [unclassified Saccharopolyspora]|uniref:MFS transporter n=1 Tax=unclassified Saccharopolyspora TaxID=2646250 RepID=UPI001CD41F08|nr:MULTISPECIES: MFS transporter [unclassified Saccharopolyspora]MCA1185948.1 MFS transporter [Saccharopolyspora sp. 6T]MCA1280760.1 MFS transporter [Saccharopolyspora sp. 7B]
MSEQNAMIEGAPPGLLSRRQALRLTGAGLSLIAACYGLARFAYGLFVPVFRSEFALDAGTAGAIASGSYVAYCIAIIASTILTPRFGGRAVATAAGVIATIGVLVVAAAPTAGVLAAGVLIAGSSTGVASPPLAHAVAHTVQAPIRDRTQTVINAGTGVGVAVAGPIAVLTHEHWRSAWVMFALVCALATVWASFTISSEPAKRSGGGVGETLIPRPFLPAGSARLLSAAALMGAASSAVWTFGRDVLVTTGGMSESGSSTAWIFLGAFGVLGAATGNLAHRFGIGTSWMATMFVLAAATPLFTAYPGVVAVAWLASAAFGAAYIALTGLLLIWGTEVYTQAPAAGVGLAFLFIALGQAVGARVVGALSEEAGPVTAFTTAAVIAVLGAFIRPAARSGHPRNSPVSSTGADRSAGPVR